MTQDLLMLVNYNEKNNKEGVLLTTWICKASAICDNCSIEYHGNNALRLMAKHCKETGHTAEVTICYGIDSFNEE